MLQIANRIKSSHERDLSATAALPTTSASMPTSTLPLIDPANEPAAVRNGDQKAKNAYETGLSFENVLVSQLAQQLAATVPGSTAPAAPTTAWAAPATTASAARAATPSSSGGLGAYSSLLPQTLATSIMSGGGTGIAMQIAKSIDPALGATQEMSLRSPPRAVRCGSHHRCDRPPRGPAGRRPGVCCRSCSSRARRSAPATSSRSSPSPACSRPSSSAARSSSATARACSTAPAPTSACRPPRVSMSLLDAVMDPRPRPAGPRPQRRAARHPGGGPARAPRQPGADEPGAGVPGSPAAPRRRRPSSGLRLRRRSQPRDRPAPVQPPPRPGSGGLAP